MQEEKTPTPEIAPEKKENSFWEIVRFALIAVAIVIPIRIFIAQPFVVSGSSMFPTFENGDYLIVDEISYRLGEPERGDVVIFRYPKDPSTFYIKRVIGLPSESIEIRDSVVKIINDQNPEGFTLPEDYVKNISKDNLNVNLSDEEYFVMGDNRIASSDSRVWGPVREEFLIGRAFLRLLPVKHIGLMPGDVE